MQYSAFVYTQYLFMWINRLSQLLFRSIDIMTEANIYLLLECKQISTDHILTELYANNVCLDFPFLPPTFSWL